MIENLSQYWDKADGKTKQKILTAASLLKNLKISILRVATTFLLQEIKSIMFLLGSNQGPSD